MYNRNWSRFIDWDIKSFLLIIHSLQLAVIGAIALDLIGLNIPILRQLVGFIYLSFVPGILIVRLLKLKNLKNTEILLYTIGLSIFTLMFTGFLLNIFGSYFVSNPLSTVSLISTISLIVIILSYICYKLDKGTIDTYTHEKKDTKNNFLSSSTLFLMLIPFLSVFGTYMVNYYNNNLLLLLLIVIICFVVLLIGFNIQLIHKDLYPLAIFVIAISLLLHNSLIFTYLYGWDWDIHFEYYLSNLVNISGFWNSQIPSNINSMLSIVILAPIYSHICNLSLTWVFKIIYPFIFSFVPLGIFHIYQRQTENDTMAFLSVIYFMSISTFYTEMLDLTRQQIAEFFFVILIAIIVSNVELTKKKLLALIFMFGIITSHYGLSYLLLCLIIVGYLFFEYILNSKSDTFNLKFIFIFFIFTISWYMYFSSGSLFQQVLSLITHYYDTLFEEIFVTKSAVIITSKASSLWGNILKILYIISQLFTVVGFIYVLKNHKKLTLSKEYIAFSFMLLCSLSVSLVYSNTGMNLHRLYHISTILLSIYFMFGGYVVLSVTNKSMNKILPYRIKPERILTLFIITFLLISIGFVQEISKIEPSSISISQDSLRIKDDTDIYEKMYSSIYPNFYSVYIPDQDFYGTTWLSSNRNVAEKIYVDNKAKGSVFISYGMMPFDMGSNRSLIKDLSIYNSIEPNTYIYLKYTNVVYGLVSNILSSEKEDAYFKINEFLPVINSKNKIYTNGANYVFK